MCVRACMYACVRERATERRAGGGPPARPPLRACGGVRACGQPEQLGGQQQQQSVCRWPRSGSDVPACAPLCARAAAPRTRLPCLPLLATCLLVPPCLLAPWPALPAACVSARSRDFNKELGFRLLSTGFTLSGEGIVVCHLLGLNPDYYIPFFVGLFEGGSVFREKK